MGNKKPFEPGEPVYLETTSGRLYTATISNINDAGIIHLNGVDGDFDKNGNDLSDWIGRDVDHIVHRSKILDAEYAIQSRVRIKGTVVAALNGVGRERLTDAGLAAIVAAIKEMKDGMAAD